MRAIAPSRIGVLGCLVLVLVGAVACSDGEGGMFQDVTFDPAKERVKALEDDTDAVLATLDEYFAAVDAQDAELLGGLFTQRAEVYLDDAKARPAADFLAGLPARWAGWTGHTTTYRLGGATLSRPYGWAMVTGAISYQVDTGEDVSAGFAATFGVEQQGDRWLISHLHLTQVIR